MPEITAERLISLNEAAKLLGRRVCYSTFWRWGQRGIRGHKLRLTRVGGRTMVTVEALEDFLAAINAPPGAAIPTRANQQRPRDVARAEYEFGI